MNSLEIEVVEEARVLPQHETTDTDEAALLRIQEMKNNWRLRPEGQEKVRKKKNYSRSRLLYISLFIVFLAILLLAEFAVVVNKVSSDHHHHKATKDNYTVALEKALLFFDAQRSGKLPELNNNVAWRADSCLNDGRTTSFFQDLSGGYYDSGSATKSSFTTSFALTMLSWSVIEYHSKYEAVGQLDHAQNIIKWGVDYLTKTFNFNAKAIDRIVEQVGGEKDLYCWTRPEDIHFDRPVVECQHCPEIAAEMAAALAAASIVFNDNATYSSKLVHGSKLLFNFSHNQIGEVGAKQLNIWGNYWDDLIWAATWLYYATGDRSYLWFATRRDVAEQAGAFRSGPQYGVLSKDNKLPGAQVLLTRLRLSQWGKQYPYEEIMKEYHNQTSVFMCSYLSRFTHFKRTKGGLAKLNFGEPQPLQYTVNAAFLAKVFYDYLATEKIAGWNCGPYFMYIEHLQEFAQSQIEYILGINPLNLSYVVGYGKKYSQQVHHRGASIPNDGIKYNCEEGWIWRDSPNPNPNTIIGAMVAGPDENDQFEDTRRNKNFTEPTLVGNAGLVAALVAVSIVEPIKIDQQSMNKVIFFVPSPPAPPPPWQP